LTWMDAKVGNWVVTPRIGKPVEVNALWYNALRCMVDFAALIGESTQPYQELAQRCRGGFKRFWNNSTGYCFDVLDGPQGDDARLRPNQLLAVSLPYQLLTGSRARDVVDACSRYLYTSYGLRSLAPFEAGYQGHYGGDLRIRDAAYHQGTVWSWLMGAFVRAHLNIYGDKRLARAYLLPLMEQLANHGVGSISEIFDGDPPYTARGCFAQAWGVAELLRAWLDTRE
ncbi:MAG: amylo-alpha-1,6-glucosidase, partial [Anaerolineales bacterium]